MIVGLDAKIVIKRSTTASEVPTVAPSNDHTDGAWSKTDVYSGEFYLNETDEKLFIRVGGTIKELQFAGGGSDGNGIFDAANNGTAIPTTFSADLTDSFDIGDANNYTRFVKTDDMVVFTDTTTYKGYQAINDTNALDVRIDFAANRFGKGVIRNTHFLAFEMNWNGLPASAGTEIMRLNTNQTVSIGSTANTSKLLVRGNGTTNSTFLVTFENNSGVDKFIIKDDGQIGIGAGTTAGTNVNFASYALAANYTKGFGFYSSTGVTRTVEVQHLGGGASPIAFNAGFQGSPTGEARAVQGVAIQTSASTNIGIYGQAEDGTVNSYGVQGYVHSNTNAGSGLKTGVYGLNVPRINYNGSGGYFLTQQASPSTVYTSIEMIGVEGRSTGSTNASSSGVVSIGGRFSAINGASNYGVWIENGLLRYDTTVNATAGTVQGQIEIDVNGTQYFIEVKQ